MFRRELHRAMAQVLEALDAEVLERHAFRFGGGTCLSLGHDEYRLSRDLDFVCASPQGYAELRFALRDQIRRSCNRLFRSILLLTNNSLE